MLHAGMRAPRRQPRWATMEVSMKNRLSVAMGIYAMLAILSGFTLDGGLLRNAVWILLAALAIKTYIAHRAGW